MFDVEPLAHQIDPSASSYRVLQPKIELKLVKKDAGIKWTKLEGEDESTLKMGRSFARCPSHLVVPDYHSGLCFIM